MLLLRRFVATTASRVKMGQINEEKIAAAQVGLKEVKSNSSFAECGGWHVTHGHIFDFTLADYLHHKAHAPLSFFSFSPRPLSIRSTLATKRSTRLSVSVSFKTCQRYKSRYGDAYDDGYGYVLTMDFLSSNTPIFMPLKRTTILGNQNESILHGIDSVFY